MAEQICEIEFDRRDLSRPIVLFVRLADPTGATVLSFPCRLERGVTRTWPMKLDPAFSLEVVAGAQDEQVTGRIRRVTPPGLMERAVRQAGKYARAFANYLDKITPEDSAGRIVPWSMREPPPPAPRVSIVIPTRDRADLLARAVETLFEDADWPNKELVVVDNGSVQPETFALFNRIRQRDNVTVLRDERPFNFSQLINTGALAATGEVLAIMNNDVITARRDWIAPLAGVACDPEVGVVGAKLLSGDGLVQHAGIALGIRGLTGHAGVGRAPDDPGPYGILSTRRRVSAVTGACMFTRKEVFQRLGGFDERYVVEMNDIDYCLRASAMGFAVIYDAESVLTHHEGSSRRERPLRELEVCDRRRFIGQWSHALVKDPYYPSDLTLKDESLSFLTAYDR